MSHEYDLTNIKNMSDVREDKDMKQISSAVHPGFHCPLYASVMTASSIENLAILVAGTEECAFYSKSLVCRTSPWQNDLFSLVLSKNDITFGCSEKLDNAVRKIDAMGKYRALLVITTCVIGLTGEDFTSVLNTLKDDVRCNIMLVSTDHFTEEIPISGLRDTLSALIEIMEYRKKKKNTVNILGHRSVGFDTSELAGILRRGNIKTNSEIPAHATIDDIMNAPAAGLNIVTNFSGLGLAEKMKNKFSIDYVFFNTTINPENIKRSYHALEKALDLPLSPLIDPLYHKTVQAWDAFKTIVSGKTFVFASPPISAFDISLFLCDSGMTPLWIQAVALLEGDRACIHKILRKAHDPKVSKALNPVAMDFVRDRLQPDYYFTSHMGDTAAAGKAIPVSLANDSVGFGFERPLKIMKTILRMSEEKTHGPI